MKLPGKPVFPPLPTTDGTLFVPALEDALASRDVDFETLEIPLNSNRLWELVSGK